MKVLWITNLIIPAASRAFNLPSPNVGGWMDGLYENISENDSISLGIATVYNGKEIKKICCKGCYFFLIPHSHNRCVYDHDSEKYWTAITDIFKPDIVHIHGTEFPFGLEYITTNFFVKKIVSIQGLVSVYYKYYTAGMGFSEILSCLSIRDIIRFDSMFQAKEKYFMRGKNEIKLLQSVNGIIGRTMWDYAHSKHIAPDVKYFIGNEILRNNFYNGQWNINAKINHRIFLSQAGVPLKGAHQVIKAIRLLINDFPNIELVIAGNNPVLSSIAKRSGYGIYLMRLIKKYKLCDNIKFIGALTAIEMKSQYLNAHIFICPSSIENSPNSLCEAQILGVPCIASYVGGTPDLCKNNSAVLYQYEEYDVLAEVIRKIFTDADYALELSRNAISEAKSRHNPDAIAKQVINIYKLVLDA